MSNTSTELTQLSASSQDGGNLSSRQDEGVSRAKAAAAGGAIRENEFDRAGVIAGVCEALTGNRPDEAGALLMEHYPFVPLTNAGRHYTEQQALAIYLRDGFVDRYSGIRLVSPPALRLISRRLPTHFPFQANWRTDACHFAYWELAPTVDHMIPVSRGGADAAPNWVTTSMVRNSAKANFTIDELGWRLHPPGRAENWDGLLGWFLNAAATDPAILEEPYLRRWHRAARALDRRPVL